MQTNSYQLKEKAKNEDFLPFLFWTIVFLFTSIILTALGFVILASFAAIVTWLFFVETLNKVEIDISLISLYKRKVRIKIAIKILLILLITAYFLFYTLELTMPLQPPFWGF